MLGGHGREREEDIHYGAPTLSPPACRGTPRAQGLGLGLVPPPSLHPLHSWAQSWVLAGVGSSGSWLLEELQMELLGNKNSINGRGFISPCEGAGPVWRLHRASHLTGSLVSEDIAWFSMRWVQGI